MLLALLILHLTALTFANPFHKYPYVFIIDVGNEELEKVNTEQIRISKQGGSLALRYPAIRNGEDIARVRVSGIDFGTDLKANIVEGGPGYKYVVLVLMGKPGVNFDAVITIQTVRSENSDKTGLQNVDSSSNTDYQVFQENDQNDSAEDLNDSAESENVSQVSVSKSNADLTQESSSVYSYAVNEALSGYGNNIHSNEDDAQNFEQNDIHVPYRENLIEETDSELDDYTNESDSPRLTETQSEELHNNEDYSLVSNNQNYANDDANQQQVNSNLYEELKQNLYNGRQTYPQRREPDDSGTVFIEEQGDNNGSLDLEEIFDDDYDNVDSTYYSDTNNNNFIDRNDGSAIAY